ncbi:MAG: hypothetical protein MAGBODY4_00199 [Candidatus Marinimicrobia bacterium]|nr:hypothetical protein [Candidatus Neomarinimicrobiota bacterium]
MTTLNYGDMDVRTEEDPGGTGERFSAMDLSLGFVYANNLTDRFSIGGQFKVIREEIWHMAATTAAVDLGVLYFTTNKNLSLGMSISNFGGKMQLAGRDVRFYSDPDETMYGNNDQIPAMYELQHWPLPLTFRVGIAANIIDTRSLQVKIAADALHPSDNSEYINIGGEIGLFEQFFIRGGMRTLFMVDREGGLSVGAGLKHAFSPNLKVKIDYGWSDYNRLTYINMLTVSLLY